MNFPTVKGYITYAAYSADEVMHLVGRSKPSVLVMVEFRVVEVPVASNRLEVFRRSPQCVECGRVGTVFLLQTFRKYPRAIPHLNLYYVGPSGHYHLMTQDHIIPRSHGGSNDLFNLQTMCRKCNHTKGSTHPLTGQKAPDRI